MSAVVEVNTGQNFPVAQAPMNPMQMLGHAVQQGMPIETLRELMQLKKEWEADEARRQFNEAFAAFKAEAIVIVKNTEIKEGPLKGKKHANLFDVVSAVTPKLSAHGLTIAWKLTKDEKDWLEVTCTLRHSAGHFENVSMGSGPDMGPGRNSIQARCSAKTYLERYTATAILGLAAENADDDGDAAGKPDGKPAVALPADYKEWQKHMETTAKSGIAKLQEAWNKTAQELRDFATKHDVTWWQNTKRAAAKVTP